MPNIVEPVNKGHPREKQHMVFIDKWSLFEGFIELFNQERGYWITLWSLFGGGQAAFYTGFNWNLYLANQKLEQSDVTSFIFSSNELVQSKFPGQLAPPSTSNAEIMVFYVFYSVVTTSNPNKTILLKVKQPQALDTNSIYVIKGLYNYSLCSIHREKFWPFSVILKRSDILLEFSFYISYVKPLIPELEKGRSGTVMGDHFSHISLQDDPWYI